MKLFTRREIFKAYEYASNGGQAVHVYDAMRAQFPDAPQCFKDSARWGHLIDYDKERLIETARKLGIKRIVVAREGQRGQHVDLCKGPLKKAIEMCEGDEDEKDKE